MALHGKNIMGAMNERKGFSRSPISCLARFTAN
jgi:hypothetical protein